ncbi:hypothetical protein ACMATS_05795 [Streptoverticillium reticulum]|uniref:hypothetical protein n=1 Tax=Streptoverticillium reticulum TaxID=1433415 RepID=UPI0039BEE023
MVVHYDAVEQLTMIGESAIASSWTPALVRHDQCSRSVMYCPSCTTMLLTAEDTQQP